MTFFNLTDPDRFHDLPQHRIVMKCSCDIHGEAWDVTSMIITGMSPQQHFPSTFQEASDVPYRE